MKKVEMTGRVSQMDAAKYVVCDVWAGLMRPCSIPVQ